MPIFFLSVNVKRNFGMWGKGKKMVYSNISNFRYTLPNFHNYFRITETGKKTYC